MNKDKKIKFFNKRLKIILVLCLILIGALLAVKYKSSAFLGQYLSTGPGSAGPEINYEDLVERYDILCCQHGTHIPDESKFKQTLYCECGETPYNSKDCEGGVIASHTHHSEDSGFTFEKEQTETHGNYHFVNRHRCDPMEAYIIAEMLKNKGYVADVQNAWWGTITGGKGAGPDVEAGLLLEARAFQAYINRLTGGNITYANQEYKLYDEKGNVTGTGTIEAPVLTYEPKWNEDADQNGVINEADVATVSWRGEEQYYYIGPFSIDYVMDGINVKTTYTPAPNSGDGEKESIAEKEAKKALENAIDDLESQLTGTTNATTNSTTSPIGSADNTTDINNINGVGTPVVGATDPDDDSDDNNTDLTKEQKYFAFIEKAELYSNLGKLKFGKGKDWEFVWLNNQGRDPNDTYKYPYPNEVFYIKVKYKPNMTYLTNFKFQFAYLNAGGVVDEYEGDYNTVAYSSSVTNHYKEENGEKVFDYADAEASTKLTNHPSQALAVGIIGVKWWERKTLEKEFDLGDSSYLKIVKTVKDEDGEVIPIDDTFYFNIYIDGKFFQCLKVETHNGRGSATSEMVKWTEGVPSYRVEEVNYDPDKYIVQGPWTGSMAGDTTIKIDADNTYKWNKSKLKIDKRLINSTDALEGETFKFIITFTGDFKYQGQKYNATTENPFVLEVEINQGTNWTWESDEFYWTTEAPHYSIVEDIPDDAKYELVGEIAQGTGYLIKDETKLAIATNTPTTDEGYIEIDKTFINATEALEDEVFKFKIVVKGRFTYGNSKQELTELELTGDLTKGNEWHWESDVFKWKGDEAPTYTVTEVFSESYDGDAELVSIGNDDYTIGKDKLDEEGLNGRLHSGKNVILITNKEIKDLKAKIKIIKKSEAVEDDIKGKSFTFKVTIEAKEDEKFSYGDEKDLTKKEFEVSVTADGEAWVSEEIKWKENMSAPKYTIEEIIPDDTDEIEYQFVSISNNDETITAEPKIKGELKADQTIVITAINKGEGKKTGAYIKITKELIAEKFDELDADKKTFKFKVTIKGTFKYDGTEYKDDTLELEDITVTAGDPDGWMSGYIEWKVGDKAPSYTVEEVDLREDVQFVSLSNRLQTVRTKKISGPLQAGVVAQITAVNKQIEDKQGYIQLLKKSQDEDDLKDLDFPFKVKLEGKFKYGDEEVDGVKEIEVTVKADGDPWVSEMITWKENVTAPTYTITEDEEKIKELAETDEKYEHIIFVSISNGTQTNTKNSITGSVIETKEKEKGDPKAPVNVIVAVNAKEKPKILQGRIQLKKDYVDAGGNEIKDRVFKFKITVGEEEFVVEVKSGSIWRSGYFFWLEGEDAPKYSIEELEVPDGCDVSIDKPSGQLEAQEPEKDIQGIIFATATNTNTTNHKSKIVINKIVEVNDKLSITDVKGTFTFDVSVTGTFRYKGVNYVDDTMTIVVKVSENTNWTWESDEIEWFDKAPVYGVEEVDIPSNWKLVSMTDNASGELGDGQTITVDCTNEWSYTEKLVLTMEMGGKVWDDTNRTVDKYVDRQENGIIDEGESGIENVLVKIYRVTENGDILSGVYAYDEKNLLTPIDPETYTDKNGNWSFGAISVPAYVDENEAAAYGNAQLSYDVEFWYDGQTYEPTTFLATSAGSASAFKNSATSARDNFYYDSMAIDDDGIRSAFNATFQEIKGQEPMDQEGNTVGSTNAGKTLHYSSVDSVSLLNADNTRKISTLDTRDKNGYIYDDLLINAKTSFGGLTFPFDRSIHLTHWDKEITDIFSITYYFTATYNYLKSINLGLIEREPADMSIEKDLDTATVVINGKVLRYKYNRAIDLDNPDNSELLYKQIAVADENIEYRLGLYSEDYYYRASMYDGSEAGDALDGFYSGKLNLPRKATEMDIFLTYRMIVYNESETYDVTVNEIADYFDSTFELITKETEDSEPEKIKRYVQTINGRTIEGVVQLAEHSKATYFNANGEEQETIDVQWDEVQDVIKDSREVEYTKITTKSLADNNRKLASGERVEVSVTFRVEKDNLLINEHTIQDAIKIGEKHNVVEITNFSSYYSTKSKKKWNTCQAGNIAGRIDEDSAPDNINLTEFNEKTYYEDDTDAAPVIVIDLNEEDRAISGVVWDDAQTDSIAYSQMVGNGKYNPDEGDRPIADMTTEILEIISIPTDEVDSDGNKVYKEYEFEWDTDKEWPELGNQSLKDLTGFEQSIVTDKNGEYSFISIPAGNFRVRYVYGDKKVETGNSGYEEVLSGQDYKSTTYQAGFDNDSDDDGYIDNEWHDLENKELANARVSDSRDNEARRLYITAKSQMLTYDNNHVLDYADDKESIKKPDDDEFTDEDKEKNEELFGNYADAIDKVTGKLEGDPEDELGKGYYMYTETAKINLTLEDVYKIGYTEEEDPNKVFENATSNTEKDETKLNFIDGDIKAATQSVGTKDFTYNVKNVDCGIEERSPTRLTLDKQIREILLTTSDNKVILDAIFDINYEIGDNGEIEAFVDMNREASIGIEHMAPLNRTKNSQGYRYMIVDGDVLQGTTTTVRYQLTVFNTGETDRTAKIQQTLWKEVNKAESEEAARELVKAALDKVSTPLYSKERGRVILEDGDYKTVQYGTYLGKVYFMGSQLSKEDQEDIKENVLVTTKVHQMLDYIDADIDFINTDNNTKDHSWANMEIQYLLDNKLIDPEVVKIIDKDGKLLEKEEDGKTVLKTAKDVEDAGEELGENEKYTIINKEYKEYITETKNNIITTIDNGGPEKEEEEEPDTQDPQATPDAQNAQTDPAVQGNEDEIEEEEETDPKEGMGTNPGFVKDLYTFSSYKDYKKAVATIALQTSRYYSSESDGSDVDNIAEIIKYENTVGRRDYRSVAGNTNTFALDEEGEPIGEYAEAGKEPDTDATERITLSPPTGLNAKLNRTIQLIAVVIVAGVILAVGIVLIKKKVLNTNKG